MSHIETHKSLRKGWLRAAVLGANDGIVSTASLIIGVAAANSSLENILLAGTAGLVAGAMSMAAGEYVSVCSQADSENADLELEKNHIEDDLEFEKKELAEIYENRGLDSELAKQVTEQLMAYDALGAHARDELGISEINKARPIQAALSSAGTFTIGAALPILAASIAPQALLMHTVAGLSLISLAGLGSLAAHVGGAPKIIGATRVIFLGTLAMGLTAVVGSFFGVVV